MYNELIHEVYLGAILGAGILAAAGIIFFKTYPKEVKDLECSRCLCRDVCSQLGEDK